MEKITELSASTTATQATQVSVVQQAVAAKYPKPHTFTAIYQIGGSVDFSWRKCPPVATYSAGADLRDELRSMGYPAELYRTDILAELGMPTEYRTLKS